MNMKENSQYQQNSSLFLVPEVQGYRIAQEPLLTYKKKQIIEEQLKLEKVARKQASERQKNTDYFLKYDYNPFVIYNQKDVHTLIKMKQEKEEKSFDNIVDKMRDLTPKESSWPLKPSIQNKSKDFQILKSEVSHFSKKLVNTNIQKQTETKSESYVEGPFRNKSEYQFMNSANFDIQKIANEKEQNFFMKVNDNFNIFSVARNDIDEVSAYEKLKKYHFSFNSMCEKISKLKIPTYRDLSRLGRRTSLNMSHDSQSIIDYIDSTQLSFKLNYLIYDDVMSIASQRFSVEFISKLLNGDDTGAANKESSEISSEEEENIVVYREDQVCRNGVFIDENEEFQEIKDYQKLHFNVEENKHSSVCQRKEKKIVDQLNIQKNLYDNTIKDNTIHFSIKDQVKRQIENFYQMNSKNIDIDRLVRANKLSKNKNQSIKMRALLETLVAKNKHDQIIQRKKNQTKN